MNVSRGFIDKTVPQSDIAILTISRNAGEGGDRRAEDGDWTLTGAERKLLQDLCDAYHYAGKPVVVVLNIGGVIETASWKNLPDAVLLAWTPGQEGGYTVADVLCGASYPSGKLPMTFPVTYFDIPSSFNFPFDYVGDGSMNPFASNEEDESTNELLAMFGMGRVKKPNVDYTEYKEGIWVGYRYFSTVGKNVSYPFGYGLSYTAFTYSKPAVKVAKDGTVTATVTVTNTGSFAGKEAVQLYVTAPDGGLVKPACELSGRRPREARLRAPRLRQDPRTEARREPDAHPDRGSVHPRFLQRGDQRVGNRRGRLHRALRRIRRRHPRLPPLQGRQGPVLAREPRDAPQGARAGDPREIARSGQSAATQRITQNSLVHLYQGVSYKEL